MFGGYPWKAYSFLKEMGGGWGGTWGGETGGEEGGEIMVRMEYIREKKIKNP